LPSTNIEENSIFDILDVKEGTVSIKGTGWTFTNPRKHGQLTNNKNQAGCTPLHLALWNDQSDGRHIEVAKMLIGDGAHLQAKSKASNTPLDVANTDKGRRLLLDALGIGKTSNMFFREAEVEDPFAEAPAGLLEAGAGRGPGQPVRQIDYAGTMDDGF
jgi:hypothetical protein